MEKKFVRSVFNFSNLLLLLISSFAWFAFMLPFNIIVAFLCVIILVSGLIVNKRIINTKKATIIFIINTILFCWSLLTVSISYAFAQFFAILPIVMIVTLPELEKVRTLSYITKYTSVILLISIIVYIGVLIVNIAPPLGTFVVPDNSFYEPYNNYIFYIEGTSFMSQLFHRFNGPFLEPGHLSIVVTFLIIANNFEFKKNKYLYVLLISVILSFSLAGYLTLLIAYFLIKVKNFRILFTFFIFLLATYISVAYLWNGGDNIVNELIFSRMEYDDEKGIAGNNRTTEKTDEYFEANLMNGSLITGLGVLNEDEYITGAGYKIYLLRYGIIAAFLTLCVYFSLIPKHPNKKYAYSFLIIVVLIFMQRAYPTWYSWLLPFTLGCGIHGLTKPSEHNIQYKYKYDIAAK